VKGKHLTGLAAWVGSNPQPAAMQCPSSKLFSSESAALSPLGMETNLYKYKWLEKTEKGWRRRYQKLPNWTMGLWPRKRLDLFIFWDACSASTTTGSLINAI
jgi:hypothetical protein